MNLRCRLILIGLLLLGLAAFTACKPQSLPISQSADELPIHPDMVLVSQPPGKMARTAVNLDVWLRSVCLGKWSYYVTSDDAETMFEWYETRLRWDGWRDAVEEDGRLSEEARLSNWGVWHDQDQIVLLVTQPITPPVRMEDEPEKIASVVIRQCAFPIAH